MNIQTSLIRKPSTIGRGFSQKLQSPKPSSRLAAPTDSLSLLSPVSKAPEMAEVQTLKWVPNEARENGPSPAELLGCTTQESSTGCLFLDAPAAQLREQSTPPSLEEFLRTQAQSRRAVRSRFGSYSHNFDGRLDETKIPNCIRQAWAVESQVPLSEFLNHPFDTSGVQLKSGGISAETKDEKLESLDYTLRLKCPGTGKSLGSMSRALYFSDDEAPEIHHGFFELDVATQSKGIAKELLARSVEMYDKVGVEKVTLTAGLDVGGYAWAKYGFKPDSPEETWELFDQVRDNLQSLDLPARTRNLVSKLLQDDDPKTVWTISDLQQQVADRRGGKTALGKALLLGTCWQGELNLKDPVARARFEQYVGS